MVASRVFSPSQMKRLMGSEEGEEWRREKIIQDGVILVLLPKRLPSLGRTDEEAERYTRIYERYLALVFGAIERHGGSHDILSMDGVLGFWNVPLPQEESERHAFRCARECLELVPRWQQFIDSEYRTVDERYTAAFDLCLHRCAFYAGCVGTGEIQSYALSGDEVNFAIAAAQSQIRDETSSIRLSAEFKEAWDASGGADREDLRFKTVYYSYGDERRRLHQWEPGPLNDASGG